MSSRQQFAQKLLAIGLACAITGCLAGDSHDYSYVTNLDSPGDAIVCFGDDVVRGYGATNNYYAFPERMVPIFRKLIKNRGKIGDTTASAIARIETDVANLNPRVVVIGFGRNDFRENRDSKVVMRDLEEIVHQIQAIGAMTVILHPTCDALGTAAYAEGFKDIAQRTGSVFMPDIFQDLLGNPKYTGNADLLTDPDLPNNEGNQLMADRVAKVLQSLLKQADAALAQNTTAP